MKVLAIIRKGNGQYYTSLVFGYYSVSSSIDDDYQKYLDSIYNQFYIVLDESKTKLIKQAVFDRKNKHLEPLILIVDHATDDWNIDQNNNGCVNYLDWSSLLTAVEGNSISSEMLSRCVIEDSKIEYQEYQTVKTQKDLENLDRASRGFHDAYIKDFKEENDSLYILFDGTWGCKIELWFEGNVSYSTESRDPEEYDPYWFDSTLIMSNGYFILVDEGNMTEEKIDKGYCWFKGNKLKYHIIPN